MTGGRQTLIERLKAEKEESEKERIRLSFELGILRELVHDMMDEKEHQGVGEGKHRRANFRPGGTSAASGIAEVWPRTYRCQGSE